jgi:hypothetical protein
MQQQNVRKPTFFFIDPERHFWQVSVKALEVLQGDQLE